MRGKINSVNHLLIDIVKGYWSIPERYIDPLGLKMDLAEVEGFILAEVN